MSIERYAASSAPERRSAMLPASAARASDRPSVGDGASRLVQAAPAARQHDRADRRDQQQERGDLEGQQELRQQQLADRRGRAEAGAGTGAPCAVDAPPGPSRAPRCTARRAARPRTSGAAECRSRRAPARERLVGAADVGDDEDVEHHHRAGVDDDLRGRDELRAQQQEQRGQREQVARPARARCRRGCAARRRRWRRRCAPIAAMKKRTARAIVARSLLALAPQRRALGRLGEQHLLGEDQVASGCSRTARSRGPS